MRALIQRVTEASVTVDGTVIGAIDAGLLVFFCAMQSDSPDMTRKLAAKISKLRIFADDAGKMNRSLLDTGGSVLVVSQFTLAADTSRGNRPGYSAAAHPDEGRAMYDAFVRDISDLGITTATGEFGADMAVRLLNDGPSTIWIDL